MNRRCNFNCAYCFRRLPDEDRQTEDPACGKYSAEHIAQRFDKTGKVWQIYMTGGEPLLYPGFVELAKALTHRHYLSVSTNLSTANANELAEAVEVERILIRANVHILEREKSKDGLKEFLRKFLHFQERGFDIRLVYVAYPPLFGRIKQDLERFSSEGVRQIKVKVFQGKYEGKRYPRDYTDREQAIIRGFGLDNFEQQILDSRVSFLGRKCEAGHLAFYMDISGNVTRCVTLKDVYGNLFEGTFRPGDLPRRCPVKKCGCAYEGIILTGAMGSAVPSNIVVHSVKFSVAVSELIARLSSNVSR